MSAETVVLGASCDLHPGIHGSLLADAPAGVDYDARGATHHFLFPARSQDSGSPHRELHWGEFVEFPGSARTLAHSARWPVVGRHAWVTDLDDFGYPLLAGRHALDAAFRRAFREPWTPTLEWNVSRRVHCMLTGYAHPSCKAILFRTRRALRIAESWLGRLRAGPLGEAFLAKSEVMYPGQRQLPAAELAAKWGAGTTFQVLFCGGDFRVKNGRLALRVMTELARTYPDARFVYLGLIPAEEMDIVRDAPSNFHFAGWVPRDEVLAHVAQSQILFHPARSESFGMVLMEAAAGGAAIVCARGRGMDHVHEFIDEDAACFIDRSVTASDEEEAAFGRALMGLLADRDRARALAMRAYDRLRCGPLSLTKRNQRLIEIYDLASFAPAKPPFLLDHVPYARDSVRVRLSDESLLADGRRFRELTGQRNRNFAF